MFLIVALGGPALRAQAAPPARVSSSEIIIDRVEFLGVTAFDQETLGGILTIGSEDLYEPRRAVRTVENLEKLYKLSGYESVLIASDLIAVPDEEGRPRNVLRFHVQEGKPIRIAAIRIDSEGIRNDFLRVGLLARTGLRRGDLLDQEKVKAARRALQDFLFSEEFIGASVDVPQVLDAPAMPQKTSAGEAAKWVTLVFKIDMGDKVTFGFRGNHVLSRSRLVTLIDEQRLLGFNKDYVSAIRSRIEDEYRASGYAHVRVKAFNFERNDKSKAGLHQRHISYEIEEGPRVVIRAIDFEGNQIFQDEDLRKRFFSFAPRLVQRKFYVEKDVEKTSELLIEWLKAQGYLTAKLVTVNRVYNPANASYSLMIYLYEGEQTRLRDITFSGVVAFSTDEVKRVLSVREGEPLNLFAFTEGLEALKNLYRSRGYLDARISNEAETEQGRRVVEYSHENRFADIRIEIAEGVLYRASDVAIEGLTRTRREVVERELSLKPGDVLEERKIAENESRLRRLGIFSSVEIQSVEDHARPGHRKLIVSLAEGAPGLVAGGIGFRNDQGLRLFGQSSYANLWGGRNHTLSLGLNLNRRFDQSFCDNNDPDEEEGLTSLGQSKACFLEWQMQLDYLWPWFAFGATNFRPKVTWERTQFLKYDASTASISATWERRLLHSLNLTGLFTVSYEQAKIFNASESLNASQSGGQNFENREHTIASLIPAVQVDLRDNPLAPTSGFFGSASFEYAPSDFLSNSRREVDGVEQVYPVGYYRLQARADGFIPLSSRISWYLSFRTGFARNNEPPPENDRDNPNYAIPLIKQFTLGGVGSVRGFAEQSIRTPDNYAIRGTISYVNYRTQIDLPVVGQLRFGPFLDAGNVQFDKYSLGNLRYGAGFGFHYLSPVGPVNFDWGFNLDPRPQEDKYRFYFSIGVL